MKNKFKLISLLLALCLIFGLFSGFATVATAETVSSVAEPYTAPAIIDPEETAEKQYVGRVEEAETDLNTFVFQNADGTNTLRLFSHPVKYVAADGKIRDISLDIQAKSGGGFVTKDHEIITTFAKRLEDGISLSHKDVNLRLVPALSGTNPAATLSNDGKTVSYIKDAKTAFVYQLTYTGFKEDIVVKQYTGQTEYEFTLYTGGLALVKENGSYFLTDSDGQVKATVGDIIVFTADEKNNTLGEMTHQTVEANQQYTLTIHLDGEYLADPATAYPIRIDPTLEVNYDTEGSGAIEDVTIQENATYSGTLGSLFVGRHEGGYLSRVLMRFPYLEMPVPFSPMILSAQVELRDLMCQSDEDIVVYCYSYTESSPSWSESGTTTWSSVGNNYLNIGLDHHTISYGQGNAEAQRYAFDITWLAKSWADGELSPAKGIVFKAASAFENQSGSDIQYRYKTFASYNRSAYKPSLTIKYETKSVYTISNVYNGGTKYLTATGTSIGGATFSNSIDVLEGTQLWCIEYLPEYGGFNIVSMGKRFDGGVYPYVVYNYSGITGLGKQEKSSDYKLYSVSKYTTTDFCFMNLCYGNFLATSSDSDTLSLLNARNSYSCFTVTKIETETFNNFWSGGYAVGIYDGVAHVKVQLDNSILAHELYRDNDFSAALWWNGISENVIVYGPNDSVPAGITPFYVTYATDAGIAEGVYGVTVPNGMAYSIYDDLPSVEKTEILTSDWSSVTIYMNGSVENSVNPFYWMPLQSDLETQINKVICHEMGHALKLAHPVQSALSGSKHTFSGDRGDYADQMSVYAIMNQGAFNSTTSVLTAASPQSHDCVNLISKWEYHVDCGH